MLAYPKMSFFLKIVGAAFQWAMVYAFDGIRHILEAYLNYSNTCSRRRVEHPTLLCFVFERCRYCNICLNPHKCILATEFG